MAYTKSELEKLGVKSKDLSSERAKIAGLNMFDNIDDISLDDSCKGLLDYTLEIYNEYLTKLNQLPENIRNKTLREFKNNDVIENHGVEKEDTDSLKLYQETHHATAINYLIKKLTIDKIPLSADIVKKTHEILMRGTSSEDTINSGFRKNNNFFVGYYEQDEKVVQYYPISYDEIPRAIKLLEEYYNKQDSLDDLFVKSYIINGLFAALQLFADGNTRLARTFTHEKMFEITKTYLDKELTLPALCFSKAYTLYLGEYRDIISKLAVMPTEKNWLLLIKFLLRRTQDQLYKNDLILSEKLTRK